MVTLLNTMVFRIVIPANVFSDKKNMNEKGFYYETGVSTSKRIEAVGNVGRTIFWKIFID